MNLDKIEAMALFTIMLPFIMIGLKIATALATCALIEAGAKVLRAYAKLITARAENERTQTTATRR